MGTGTYIIYRQWYHCIDALDQWSYENNNKNNIDTPV